MTLLEARETAEAALKSAEEILKDTGANVLTALEVAENDLGDGNSEALLVLGTVSLTTEELSEEDTYYISFEANVSDGEVNADELNDAIDAFITNATYVASRFNEGTSATEVIRELDREVDERLEAEYNEAVEAAHRATKRDIKMAIIAIAVLLVVAVACIVATNIFK